MQAVLGYFNFSNHWFNDILYIISGISINIQYTVIAIVFGVIFGSILALFKISKYKFLKLFAVTYTSIFRGTPLLIQLSLIYFVLPQICGIKLSVFFAASLSFSLNSAAYVSEIIRSGISSIDNGQLEAAKVLGISKFKTYKDIIFPQAISKVLPSLMNELINMLKETAVISALGEADILRRANMIAGQHYSYIVPMLTAAITYYVLVLALTFLASRIEKKLQYY